jgi:tRNA pseudouridine38-40 synthase
MERTAGNQTPSTAKASLANYRVTLCYDGTDFKGWQRQPRERTVQGTIEDTLFKITKQPIVVHGAGRTDAGVHAEGQVANFRAVIRLGMDDLFRALNALLPDDLKVLSLRKVPADFHARKSARSKTYRYRILQAPRVSPFLVRYVLHWPHRLDVRAMKKAAALFVREADFSAFSSNRELHPVRKVVLSDLRKKGDEIVFTIRAGGFLRYMVRAIVGTLLEVGRGKVPPETIEELFREKSRSLRSPTAPARGLCLVKIDYPPRAKPMTQASSTGLL